MNSNSEIDDLEFLDGEPAAEESVDDFIRSLEEREKDLHITSDATVIEIAEDVEELDDLPEFLKSDPPTPPAAKHVPAPAPATVDAASLASLKSEVAALKETIERMEAERAEILLASQRRARDLENFKARTERERTETFETQVGNLALQMLPALDNLNRALDFAPDPTEDDNAGFRQFLDGVVLVNQQVNDVLAGMGVQPIAAVGECFDPNLHEAVATEPSDEHPENVVTAELLKGYRIGDRVIRHSMVKVSKAVPAA